MAVLDRDAGSVSDWLAREARLFGVADALYPFGEGGGRWDARRRLQPSAHPVIRAKFL